MFIFWSLSLREVGKIYQKTGKEERFLVVIFQPQKIIFFVSRKVNWVSFVFFIWLIFVF
jgi:hypothetical protein